MGSYLMKFPFGVEGEKNSKSPVSVKIQGVVIDQRAI